jgi:anaerobic selenocysteine-containing dehydrogenase
VVDSFLTDTAAAATLVLPTTTLLEADDLLGAYGHHHVGVARPVVAPPPGCKSDLEILQLLAERVGLGGVLDGTPRQWKERILRPDAGMTVDALEAGGPARQALSPRVLYADRRFATASGRMNLVTELSPPARLRPGYPLYLMALSTDRAQSSLWSERQEGPAVVTVHPDAAAGVSDGAAAWLESAHGTLAVRVRHDPAQRRDVALMAKGGHLRDGRCANALLPARTTDMGLGGALYDEGVRLRPR